MDSTGPVRQQTDLAEMVEMLLDKGVVINADIAVSVGDTELLGIQVRAAIASFETAAQYGLEFPEGTDPERIDAASGRPAVEEEDDAAAGEVQSRPGRSMRPSPSNPNAGEESENEERDGDAGESDDAEEAADEEDADQHPQADAGGESADDED